MFLILCSYFVEVSLDFFLPVKVDAVSAYCWAISEISQDVMNGIQKGLGIVPEAYTCMLVSRPRNNMASPVY
jgi:hypothetical protein